MITNYYIDKKLYRSLVEAVQNHEVSITGAVYNGDRPLSSTGEDITVRTMSVDGDGFPQDAITNVNCYVCDIAEDDGGYVRDGARLSELADELVGFFEALDYPNASLMVEAVTEIAETSIRQHYINIRLRLFVFEDFEFEQEVEQSNE